MRDFAFSYIFDHNIQVRKKISYMYDLINIIDLNKIKAYNYKINRLRKQT